jgi:hypothetical protein
MLTQITVAEVQIVQKRNLTPFKDRQINSFILCQSESNQTFKIKLSAHFPDAFASIEIQSSKVYHLQFKQPSIYRLILREV